MIVLSLKDLSYIGPYANAKQLFLLLTARQNKLERLSQKSFFRLFKYLSGAYELKEAKLWPYWLVSDYKVKMSVSITLAYFGPSLVAKKKKFCNIDR
jgi:hypothetical protein